MPQLSTSPPPQATLLDDLIQISRFYGANPEFALAGGGNTSAKTADRLFVKASGTALATISANGFVEMDRPALDRLLEREVESDVRQREESFKQAILAARLYPALGQRPSVECVLHHLLPRRFVVHTHNTRVNMLACSRNGEKIARELFGPGLLWLPYVDPGYVLSIELKHRLAQWSKETGGNCPDVVIMGNHGLIVCADSIEDVKSITCRLIKTIDGRLKPTAADQASSQSSSGGIFNQEVRTQLINRIAPALRGLLANAAGLPIVTYSDAPAVSELLLEPNAASLPAGGPLIPDHIVYCHSFPLWISGLTAEASPETICATLKAAIEKYRAEHSLTPIIFLVAGVGLFAAAADYDSALSARLVYEDAMRVMLGAEAFGGPLFMTKRDRGFIEDWEVEAYRKSISNGAGAQGRARGKIAIVTGAAQGFGLEIAQDLIQQGAHVVLTDMNVAGANQAAAALNSSAKRTRAFSHEVNVSESASLAAMLHQVIRQLGGCDVFISNAGVLRAESVKTQSEKDFDFTTTVNYKGYFLCVQNIAPIMAMQHLACPERLADIIQINSKSGLQGSNKNFAYAGSKFGSIGLTQSFAMELIEDGIKVNAICPGNFFDGPLWSDSEKGLFVQYLKTNKVPGAKTIDDVKHFYEQKVPMGRGCETADVMRAIYYLIEQQYETGQALPVTGGQVMLK